MATVSILRAFRGNEHVPVLRSRVNDAEAVTSSASSQTSGLVAVADEYWVVTSVGGAIWVEFGAAPTAAAGTSWLVPDGTALEVQAVVGDTVAIIDA